MKNFDEIITSIEFDNIYKIKFNRPKKFNAFSKKVHL
jgi:1,4-dihydroxy-2-naphthoyl-CoA synthase